MKYEKIIAERLLEIGAIKLNPYEPFTWASGWKSPIYCDNRKALSFPFTRDFIKSELCNVLFEEFQEADMIAGVATAGIAWGAMAADQLKLPFIYVRSKPKEHGLGNQIEGFLEANKKIIIVEDLISTGKSSLQVADVLRNSNAEVVGMLSIFNYGFDSAAEAFKKADITMKSLTNYTALLELAKEKKFISEETEQLLIQWKLNPAEWQAVAKN